MKRWMALGMAFVLMFSLLSPWGGAGGRVYASEEECVPAVTDDAMPQIILEACNVSGAGPGFLVERLVDEQTADTINTSNNNNSLATSNPNLPFPAHAYIDLGRRFHITQISTFSAVGNALNKPFMISIGDPDNWVELFQDPMDASNRWLDHTETVTTRYIRVTAFESGSILREIRLFGTPVPIDTTPPAAVADLAADASSTSITLSWSAPGNDGIEGTASEYDIRYSQEPITEGNWDQAQPIPDIPQPEPAGTIQQSSLHALEPLTTYYFAMKASDDWDIPNVSDLSNVASATTEEDSTPPAAIGDLRLFSAGSRMAVLNWTATGNDGIHGTANMYELRYSLEPITEATWEDAEIAVGLPSPALSGTDESATITGLTTETTYYMALVARDAADNVSELSNVIEVTTTAPDIVPPGGITDLAAVVSGSDVILSWTASGDDEEEGTASLYHIRYYTQPITDDNWEEATPIANVPLPLPSGSAQSATVGELPRGVYLYAALKAIDKDDNESPLSNSVKFGFPVRIALDPSMIIDETGMPSSAGGLVDEQELVGEPLLGLVSETNAPIPSSAWSFDYNRSWLEGPTAVIDLGASYDLTEFVFFVHNKSNDMSIFTGTPFQWELQFVNDMRQFNRWISEPLDTTSRYIRMHINSTNATGPAFPPYEIVVYGIANEEREPEPEPTPHSYPTMDKLIGINAFIDDPIDKMAVAGNVREYHNWRWDEVDLTAYPNNVKSFNPSNAAGGNSWFFDEYYSNFNKMGIDVFPNIKETFDHEWFGNNIMNKPVKLGDDPLLPESYEMLADHLFQYAARYGSAAVDDELLKLRDNQERLSGTGMVQYLEVGNEQDQDWNGRGAFFTPLEYAALASAVYDGHAGTMGSTFGVKNADPDMKFAMAGLAGIEIDYVKAMKFWSDFNRPDGSFPVDVINFHHYSNSRGGQHQTAGTKAVSPEEDNLVEKAGAMVDYRNRHLPGVEVWASEFGYDTNPNSTQGPPSIGTFSLQEIQGQWLLRSYLAYAAAGVDRAQMYMLRDAGPASTTTKYSTSGLVTDQGSGQQPKVSWYYVYTLKNRLAGMRFVEELPSGNPDVMIYKFVSDDGRTAYVLWCPTSDQVEVPGYELSVGYEHEVMTQVTMADKHTDGIQSYLPVEDGAVALHISETPLILLEGQLAENTPPAWLEGDALEIDWITDTRAEIVWPEANDDEGILYYSIMNGSQLMKTVTADVTSYPFNLAEDVIYDIRVVAADVTGLVSPVPLTSEVKLKDELPPTRPEGLEVLMANSSQLLLQWQPSSDNYGVAGYRIYNGDVLAGYVNGQQTTYTVSGLSPGVSYSFTVEAFDEDGNVSERSDAIDGQTEAGTGQGGAYVPPPTDSHEPPVDETIRDGEIVARFDKDELDRIIEQLATGSAAAQAIAYDAQPDAKRLRLSLPVSSLKRAAERMPNGKLEVRLAEGVLSIPLSQLEQQLAGASENELWIELSYINRLSPTVLGSQTSQIGETLSVNFTFASDESNRDLTTASGRLGSFTLRLSEAADPERMTVVRYDPDRNERLFVPAKFDRRTGEAELFISGRGLYAIVRADQSFADTEGHWAERDIRLLASKLLVQGTGASRFTPDAPISRAEFSAMLVRALGITKSSTIESAFDDIDAGDWFAGEVQAAVQAGLVLGYNDGTFRPSGTITREEMSVMLLRAIEYAGLFVDTDNPNGILERFADMNDVSAWSSAAVAALVDTGLMQGRAGGMFDPQNSATRAEGTVVLKRLLQYVGFMN